MGCFFLFCECADGMLVDQVILAAGMELDDEFIKIDDSAPHLKAVYQKYGDLDFGLLEFAEKLIL